MQNPREFLKDEIGSIHDANSLEDKIVKFDEILVDCLTFSDEVPELGLYGLVQKRIDHVAIHQFAKLYSEVKKDIPDADIPGSIVGYFGERAEALVSSDNKGLIPKVRELADYFTQNSKSDTTNLISDATFDFETDIEDSSDIYTNKISALFSYLNSVEETRFRERFDDELRFSLTSGFEMLYESNTDEEKQSCYERQIKFCEDIAKTHTGLIGLDEEYVGKRLEATKISLKTCFEIEEFGNGNVMINKDLRSLNDFISEYSSNELGSNSDNMRYLN